MKAQDLKNSILQLAIQGKLVEQNPSDEPAEVLYAKIQAEKQKLIKEGKIKKSKPLPPITEDEIPFEIPSTWKWVRLGNLLNAFSGLSYKKDNLDVFSISKYRVLRGGNIIDGHYKFLNNDVFIANEFVDEKLNLRKNWLITPLVTSIENIGKVARIDKDYNDVVTGGFVLNLSLFFDNDNHAKNYLYFISSTYFRSILKSITRKSGQAFYNIPKEKMLLSLIPLPPLEEQKRIVAKIEELEPLVQEYDKAETELTALNNDFPDKLKKSILQYAIQGKLVEQNPSDEPAEVLYAKIQAEKQKLIKEGKIKTSKSLPSITEDEIPFEIPSTWKWVRLGDIFQHNTGKALNTSKQTGKYFKYITTSNVYWNKFNMNTVKEMKFTDEEIEKYTVTKGDLLVCEGGDIGRAAIWNYDYDICIQNHIHKLKSFYDIHTLFFYYIFLYYKQSNKIGGKGIGIQGLSSGILHNIVIPLPPLEEQKRIVAKVNELLSACDKLK